MTIMRNDLGCTARVALDPALLLRFIDSKTEFRVEGHPARRRKFVNGFPLASTTDSRTLRRWRSRGGTVSVQSARRLLAHYRLDLDQFKYWCEARDIEPTVRGTL